MESWRGLLETSGNSLNQYFQELLKNWQFPENPEPWIQFSRREKNGLNDTDDEYEEVLNMSWRRQKREYNFKKDKKKGPCQLFVSVWTNFQREIHREFGHVSLSPHDYCPMTGYQEKDVRRSAFFSRIILLILQILGSLTLPKHENDGFKAAGPEGEDTGYENFFEAGINATFGGFANWDGQYFLHIATNGYTHENTMAFFPLFPMAIGTIAQTFHFLLFAIVSLHSLILVIGWLFNTWCFQNAAVVLSELVELQSGKSRHLVPTVVYLFCYNPASIFFSAFYSESLFAWMTFSCFREIYSKNLEKAILYASICAVCRSNGLINFVLVALGLVGIIVTDMRRKEQRTGNPTLKIIECWNKYRDPLIMLARIGFLCIIGSIPFVVFQLYCMRRFCSRVYYVEDSKRPPYCNLETLPYTHIQGVNWNVGFLNYFEVKQIPNFILASPVLYSVATMSWRHIKQYRIELFSLQKMFYKNFIELAFGWHGIFLVFVCLFLVHVQISTRMIMSTCPYIYFLFAEKLRTENLMFLQRQLKWTPYSFFIQTWFSLYFVIGTLAFSQGYPWT